MPIYCGVHFQELLDIRVQDVNLDSKTLLIAPGKGRKFRLLYPNAAFLTALSEWLRERAKMKVTYDWLWAFDTRRRMGNQESARCLTRRKPVRVSPTMPAFCRTRSAAPMRHSALLQVWIYALCRRASPSTTLIYTFASERPAETILSDLHEWSPSVVCDLAQQDADTIDLQAVRFTLSKLVYTQTNGGM